MSVAQLVRASSLETVESHGLRKHCRTGSNPVRHNLSKDHPSLSLNNSGLERPNLIAYLAKQLNRNKLKVPYGFMCNSLPGYKQNCDSDLTALNVSRSPDKT